MNRIYYNDNGIILNNGKIVYKEPIPLTYPGSSHTENDVIDLGGTVYTLVDGDYSGKTVGVFLQDYNHTTMDMPNGWTLASSTNSKYYHVRDLTYTDYCGYNFASYTNTGHIVAWPNTNFGYGSRYNTPYYSRYYNCAAASEDLSPRSDFWVIYYLDVPYYVRALHIENWILGLGTNPSDSGTRPHAGHELYAFAAF